MSSSPDSSPHSERVEECPTCGLHPYDFDVDEYKRELDRVAGLLRSTQEQLEAALSDLAGYRKALDQADAKLFALRQAAYPFAQPHDTTLTEYEALRAVLYPASRPSDRDPQLAYDYRMGTTPDE